MQLTNAVEVWGTAKSTAEDDGAWGVHQWSSASGPLKGAS
jgi:hypothetical protein